VNILKGYLAVNLPILRKYAGLSKQQLADRMGIRVTAIENIETGYTSSPPVMLIEKLSKVFGVTLEGLLGKEPLIVGERVRVVHVVESIDADMQFVDAEKIVGAIYFDAKELSGYNFFGIKVQDNSMMYDRICKGDIALVKQSAPIKNGNTVLCVVDGKDVLIRNYYEKDGVIVLKTTDSSGTYPEIRREKDSFSVKVIGKIVRVIQDRD